MTSCHIVRELRCFRTFLLSFDVNQQISLSHNRPLAPGLNGVLIAVVLYSGASKVMEIPFLLVKLTLFHCPFGEVAA